MKALLIIALTVLTMPAFAADSVHLFPGLGVQKKDMTAALTAPFLAEEDEDGKRKADVGHLLLKGPAGSRRAESCADVIDAMDAGFTEITENSTENFDGWAINYCLALAYATRAKPAKTGLISDQPFADDGRNWTMHLPAVFDAGPSCYDSYLELRSGVEGRNWAGHIIQWQRDAVVLTKAGAAELVLQQGAVEHDIEALVRGDITGDGRDDLLVLHNVEDQDTGISQQYLRMISRDEGDGFVLSDPHAALLQLIRQCPSRLHELLGDPCEVPTDDPDTGDPVTDKDQKSD